MIIGIDPGTSRTAFVTLDGHRIVNKSIVDNEALLLASRTSIENGSKVPIAIEMIASYGMPVGRETFETVIMIGRLMEIFESQGRKVRLVYRKDIKVHLCGTTKAKDGNVRQALIDKYGPQGTKKNPGPTYGMKADLWAALAIADYALNNPQ